MIAITVEEEEDLGKFKDYSPSASDSGAAAEKEPAVSTPPQEEAPKKPVPAPEPTVSKPSAPSTSDDRIFASPLARKLAEENKVRPSSYGQ